MEELNLDKNSLKRFGITMGIVFIFIALLVLRRNRQDNAPIFITLSIAFFLSAFIIPVFLRPIYIIWMRLAFLLGWINTRLILIILFYLVLTPIGLCMRLFGVDSLDRKIEKGEISYWKKKEIRSSNPLNYERQF